MPGEPNFYDSQASAAAALGLSTFDLKWAKREGCKAFRSGRVYRGELLTWLKRHAPIERTLPPTSSSSAADSHFGAAGDSGRLRFEAIFEGTWADRRSLLFELGEFLDCMYHNGEITAAEYVAISNKTMPLIVAMGNAWNADIAAGGYLKRWAQIKAKLIGRESEHTR